MSSASRPQRDRLSRERILRAALECADTRGIDAVKMRELGQSLGFEAMALYRHVPNKDAILEGILDLVLSEVEIAPAAADWSDGIRSSAISLHAALERHPWAAGFLTTPAGLRPVRLAFAESLLAWLEQGGFSEDERYHAYHVLDAYIVGFSLWQAGHPLSPDERAAAAARFVHEASLAEYRRLLEHHDRHAVPGPHRDVRAFEVGLDLLLGGLKEMRLRSARARRGAGAGARRARR